ncbi:MAG: hypothetical protein IIV94_10775, partial [Clostridiales bacterium]|nr:hypothetical protein [Clostridiales bacterium]
PSYILLGGISKCLAQINSKGKELLQPWENAISYAENNLRNLRNFKFWQAPVRERSKFVLMGRGSMLLEYLRGTFNIECEAGFPSHLIAMTGIGDTEDTLKRFCDAVIATDEVIDGQYIPSEFIARPLPKFAITLQEAAKQRMRSVDLEPEFAIGLPSSEFIYGFPPGIPLLMPGEIITNETVKVLSRGDIKLMMGGGRPYQGLIPVLP